ncbi:type I toxin-antitoxin system Ibs family toxin [Salmonella enterica]|nr:type I toxin-antitoxin system Ibs family toxin [Salmonella enterica]AXC79247.1 hypothetical protein DOE56_08545 [Salmonella enterica subsp. arizonae serovar 63:g,z51:-]EAN8611726.1 type I toxin-antitoxin system Ibs family toxin [Salmonella enterica subsp. arizonae serovar 48:z4,z24:-]EAO5937573.1 type I toxin-antitoxin system Ibs family toxin [Salmonella enterica subsp. houtenae serovar 48:g,z51:-]EAT8890107.1 type I toxin-antitoxin system Ibs family toxin [Salmonella enterica subsp. arizona
MMTSVIILVILLVISFQTY